MSNKIDIEKIPNSDFKITKTKFLQYLENYSFEKEIETMEQGLPLYEINPGTPRRRRNSVRI